MAGTGRAPDLPDLASPGPVNVHHDEFPGQRAGARDPARTLWYQRQALMQTTYPDSPSQFWQDQPTWFGQPS